MEAIEIYVKNTDNVPHGLPLMSFEILGPQWSGDSLMIPFGVNGTLRKVEGWCDLLFDNPYPDKCRGCPDTVHCVKARHDDDVGYLIYGGNSGVRIGGRDGVGAPIIWIGEATELPEPVRRTVEG